jgi:HlyD family secretion protein
MSIRIVICCAILSAVFVTACSDSSANRIEASGTIEGTDVTIAAEVMGRAMHIRVEEGDLVQAGDTLIIINDLEYRIQMRQAMANLDAAEAHYRLALEGFRKEDVLQAEAAFKSAESDYQRMKELISTKTITQKQYDDAYTRYIAAQQTYEKLVRGLRKEEILAARARRDQAAAQVDLLRKRVDDCIITAPQPGVVTLKAVEKGELVTTGSRVMRLTYLRKVTLRIYIPEAELGRVRLGQDVDVTIDSYPDTPFKGSVVYISPVAEFTPKNVQTKEERTKLVFGVKVQVDNPDGVLKPGLPADARIAVHGDRSGS